MCFWGRAGLTGSTATPKRIHSWSYPAFPAEGPGIRAARTLGAYRPVMSGEQCFRLRATMLTVFMVQEHRHSFVRKNAVFAVYSIYQDHEHLIPDAPELLDTFLAAVSDCGTHVDLSDTVSSGIRLHLQAQCIRNAVQRVSTDCCPIPPQQFRSDRGHGRVDANGRDRIGEERGQDRGQSSGESCRLLFQMRLLISTKAKWIRCIFELLNSPSHAVKYEAATSLTTLTQNPAAVKGK